MRFQSLMIKLLWRRARERRLHIGREGFTLVEAMIVVAVIGILAALAVVRSETPRSRAAAATMQSDLRTVGSAQEAYFADNRTYASDINVLEIQLSPGVTMEMDAGTSGWTARATHEQAGNRECALAFGDIAPLSPATGSGVILCGEASGGGLGCGG